MGVIDKLSHSTDLVNGMADRLGANLGDAIARNPEFSGPKVRSMVLRCSSCTDQDACAELQTCNGQLDAAPDYCRNKAELEAIRPR